MSLLKFKNALGEIIEIVALKGDPGEASPDFIAKYNEAMQAMEDLLAMLGTDIATLVGGKVPVSQIPAVAIHDVVEISDESELVSLTNVQKYDIAAVITGVGNSKIINVSYQLLGDNPSLRENWVEVGTGYATQAGYASTAGDAENANTINNKRLVAMTESQFASAVKDPDTWYGVYPDEEV